MKNKKQYYRVHLHWKDYVDIYTTDKEKAIKRAQKLFKKEKLHTMYLQLGKVMTKEERKNN